MSKGERQLFRWTGLYMVGVVASGIIGFIADLSWIETMCLSIALATPFLVYEWWYNRKHAAKPQADQ